MNEQQQEKLRQLYRRSRQEQPSADLDRHIRSAAQRALNRGRNRWIWGLSTAAVLLLSFNVVIDLFMGEQHEMNYNDLDLPSSMPRMEVEKKSKAVESSVEEAQQQRAVPAAPAAEPVIDFYRVLPDREMEFDMESLSGDAATPSARKMERLSRKRSIMGVEKPALVETADVKILPHRLADLLKLADGLSGEELTSGKVMLYSRNKLILTVEPAATGFSYRAWQGVEILGVREDWTIRPSSLDACNDQDVYTSCVLRPGLTGYFEAERLDHISWNQADE